MAANVAIVLFALFSLVAANSEYVTKKLCKNVDPDLCRVHNLIVDPCFQGPNYCTMKRDKKYGLTLDMTPYFSAKKLKLSMSADVDNDESFTTTIKTAEACEVLRCPLQANERRIFNIDLVLDKRAQGKFPVQFKLWDEDDESKACCTTFMIKVDK